MDPKLLLVRGLSFAAAAALLLLHLAELVELRHFAFEVTAWSASILLFVLVVRGRSRVLSSLGIWVFWLLCVLAIAYTEFKDSPSQYGNRFGSITSLTSDTMLHLRTMKNVKLLSVVACALAAAFLGARVFRQRETGLFWLLGSLVLSSVLFRAGTPSYGADATLSFLRSLGFTYSQAQVLIVPLRKSIHILFFGSLGALSFLGVRRIRDSYAAVACAALFVLICAGFDEAVQTQYATRTGSLADVLLDLSSGAVFAILLQIFFQRKQVVADSVPEA